MSTQTDKPQMPAQGIREALVKLVEKVRGIDIRTLEDLDTSMLLSGTKDEVLALLAQANSIADRGLLIYDNVAQHSGDDADARPAQMDDDFDFGKGFDELLSAPSLASKVADMCFMTKFELRQKIGRLERLKDGDGHWDIVEELTSALRRTRRSLSAVEVALAQVEGVAPRLDYTSELQTAVEIRRLYAKFWHSVLTKVDPTDDDLLKLFRGTGTQIAMLVGRDEYRDMRIHDRVQIRELQKRLLSWLRPENRTDAQTGRRLWQDIAGLAQMLQQISRRQELIEHDLAVLISASEQLFAREPVPPAIPAALLPSLRELAGLDPAVDALLAADRVDADGWREPILRLKARLAGGA